MTEEVSQEPIQDSIQEEQSQEQEVSTEASGNLTSEDIPTATAEGQDFSSDAETSEELQEDISNAIDDGASEQDIKNMVQEFKLKVNGEEVTKKYDLGNEEGIEQLKRDLQIGEANKKGMSKAKELEKLYSQSIAKLKENPWEVLKELGLDPMELAEGKINEYIEEQQKSPEQLAHEKMTKELEEARAELKRQKEDAENASFMKLQQEESQKLETEITEALDGHKTLPKSRKTVSKIADALLWAMDNGFENASVSDVIPMVEEEIRNEMRDFMDILGETDMLEEYIGQNNIEKMRSKRMAKAKANNLSSVVQTNKAKEMKKAQETPRRAIKAKDFFKDPLKY